MVRPKGRKRSGGRRKAIGLVGTFAVLALVSWFVPRRTVVQADTESATIERGPASYFHHFYDPNGLLGPVGKIDLDLDNFERATSHSVLVAAFETVPGNDPDFTMRVAEKWRPGAKGADNGAIVFVFTKERRVRAEVGYGLESALPDAEVARILDEAAVPAFRAGDFVAGLDAAVQRICERARSADSGGRGSRISPWSVLRNGVRAVPRAARTAVSAALEADHGMRLVLSFFIVVLGGIGVMLLSDTVQGVRTVARVVRTERDLAGAEKVGGVVLEMAYRASWLVGFLLLLAVGGTYLFSGSGHFGGGGVDRFW